jgi:hypothetical protein
MELAAKFRSLVLSNADMSWLGRAMSARISIVQPLADRELDSLAVDTLIG